MSKFVNPNLTREALRSSLKDFETLPEEHRLKLWMEVILKLPNNKNQYLNLRKKGKGIKTGMNIREQDEAKRKTIQRVLKCLIAHCPSLQNFHNFDLTAFVEPFSSFLHNRELIFFEIMLTILVNWCQHWFDHIPLPPYTLMSMMDIIFLKNQPELYKHLANKSVRALDYAWRWMSTSFETIVDTKEWPILWDHILVNEPSFLYYIPLAACKLKTKYLLESSTHGELMGILHSPTPHDAVSLLKEAYLIQEATPKRLQLEMVQTFHPLIIGHYPTLNPTDLITFCSENVGNINNLSALLEKIEKNEDAVEKIIAEGMSLRKWMIDH